MGALTAALAVSFVGSVATALPLFCQSLMDRKATAVMVYPHVGLSCVFFAVLLVKLVVLGRRRASGAGLWIKLVTRLSSGLAAYTLATGVLVLVSEVWDDQHLASAFWMTTLVLAHAWQYRVRALALLRRLVERTPPATPAEPARVRTRSLEVRRVVVVGTGMAGQEVIEELLRRSADRQLEITALGEEAELPYNRVRLSDALAGRATAGELALRPASWFADHDVTLRRGRPAVEIDTDRREVVDATGDRHAYDALVLATGSRPVIPPIEGADRPHVVAFRTMADVRRIVAAAEIAGTAVVVGGGLLGLEAAAGLTARGTAVTVVELGDRLMPQQLDAGASRVLERALARRGVNTYTNAAVARIGPRHVDLSSGETVDADVVVVAAGIRPETALARSTGLTVTRGMAAGAGARLGASRPAWCSPAAPRGEGVIHEASGVRSLPPAP